jgi:hypothetical protein
MATTRLIPMHQNKGKSVSQCLTDRTEYAKNPDKTDDGKFISAYECDPATVDAEFLAAKRIYADRTGRSQQSDVIAYQVRQSFRPGEVTPEKANKIGYEFAMRWTKGKHSFIVATHVDKEHIHNHIIYNSTTLDYTKKFRNFMGSTNAVRRLSDAICMEHRLSVILNPKLSRGHYGKWLGEQKKPTFSERLRSSIDAALKQQPKDFEQFLTLMEGAGYEVKRGAHTAFKGAGQQRFIRLRSLGEGYSESELRDVIAGTKLHMPRKTAVANANKQINLLVDIQAKLQAGKGLGYERWAKIFNLKQMAHTLNYLSENKLLSYEAISEKAAEAGARFHALSAQIKATEKRMAEIAALKKHIINYSKTRDVYMAYRKSGYAKKFYEEHTADLLLHKAAKQAFDELGVKKLPTVKALNAEYAELLSAKKKAFTEYTNARTEMREVLIVKANIEKIFAEGKDIDAVIENLLRNDLRNF